MNIEERYRIVYLNKKRYYEFDMTEKLPFLDETVPFLFRYKDIEIVDLSWKKMTIKILEAIDSLNPKTEEELLSIRYCWSKQDVFSRENRTNHTAYKGLFLNTNHSSSHAMMNIQCLLEAYGVKLNECYFLIRRHFVYEPEEVKDYIRNKTIDNFKKYLAFKKLDSKKADIVVKNFDVINKYLGKVSNGYNDFWLFDDYNYFTNYKVKTIDELGKRMMESEKNYKVIVRCLSFLDDFYKNRDFYDWLNNHTIEQSLLDLIDKEINYLFETLKTSLIVGNKIYGRMSLLYKKEIEKLDEMNNSKGLFKIISTFLSSNYYCKEPYISKNPIGNLTNDQIIVSYASGLSEFSITGLNSYIDKMHLKRLDNYMAFLEDVSDSFVQVDVETMVSIETFPMTQSFLSELKKEVHFYISSFGGINSETFVGYDSLPKLSIEWNKYLLMGVVRTFLNDVFTVKVSGTNYRNLSYILDIKKD